MSITVNSSTPSSTIKGYKEEADTFASAVETLITNTLAEDANSASTNIGSISFGTWSDDVQKKLESFLGDVFKPGLDHADTDLSGGNGSTFVTTAKALPGHLQASYEANKALEDNQANITATRQERNQYQSGSEDYKKYDEYLDQYKKDRTGLLDTAKSAAQAVTDDVTTLEGLTFPEPGAETSASPAGSTDTGAKETPTDFVDGGLEGFTEEDVFNNPNNVNTGKSYYVQVTLVDGTKHDAILTFNGNARSATDHGNWSFQSLDGEIIGTQSIDMYWTGEYKINVYQTDPSNYGNATVEGYKDLFGK